MRDAYKEAMDAVKAPDALVEKTLKAMLEEHKKLEENAKTEVRDHGKTGPMPLNAPARGRGQEPRPSAPKARWITHVMLPVAACLCLLLSVTIPGLLNRESDLHTTPDNAPYTTDLEASAAPAPTMQATPAPEAEITDGVTVGLPVEALATDNLATRSGPATDYRDTGTYAIKGETVPLLSLAHDAGGNGWVQCEVLYGDKLRRVYTGVKRFDAESFDLAGLPEEGPQEGQAKVDVTSKAMYGPGDGYDTYSGLTVDKGQTVSVITTENGYAQVEWTTSAQRYRAWVPTNTLNML